MVRVAGFRFAGVTAGIKASGKPDLALLACDRPAAAAAVFTRNRVVAAPVLLSRERLRGGVCQAIVVNSGNASYARVQWNAGGGTTYTQN